MALAHIVWLRPHLVRERLAGSGLLATAIASVGLLSFHGERSLTALASLGFGVIIFLACYNRSGCRSGSQLLAAEGLVLLGGASYAIYLLEAPFRDWIRVLLTGPFEWTGRVVYQPALIALGVFTYLYFESPLRRLLTRSASPTPPKQPYEEEADDLLGVRMKKIPPRKRSANSKRGSLGVARASVLQLCGRRRARSLASGRAIPIVRDCTKFCTGCCDLRPKEPQ